MADEIHPRRSDRLAMGLFSLAVGAFTLVLRSSAKVQRAIISKCWSSSSPVVVWVGRVSGAIG